MKKRRAWFYWWLASLSLLLCGSVHLLFDWLSYSSTLNSAPFSLWILVNAVVFGGPAAICGLIGWILRKKNKTRKDDSQ